MELNWGATIGCVIGAVIGLLIAGPSVLIPFLLAILLYNYRPWQQQRKTKY